MLDNFQRCTMAHQAAAGARAILIQHQVRRCAHRVPVGQLRQGQTKLKAQTIRPASAMPAMAQPEERLDELARSAPAASFRLDMTLHAACARGTPTLPQGPQRAQPAQAGSLPRPTTRDATRRKIGRSSLRVGITVSVGMVGKRVKLSALHAKQATLQPSSHSRCRKQPPAALRSVM